MMFEVEFAGNSNLTRIGLRVKILPKITKDRKKSRKKIFPEFRNSRNGVKVSQHWLRKIALLKLIR